MAGKTTITIDGPGGSGKSTVARRLAGSLGFAFLDSGAIYRAATWFALDQGLDLTDTARVLQAMDGLSLHFEQTPAGMSVFVNLVDVTGQIRTREVSNSIFHLANSGEVRSRLIGYQQAFAQDADLVAEGRDMGSVVFPDAPLKFYLMASLEIRARRRQRELEQVGEQINFEAIKEEILIRDERDSNREVAPLCKPEGAVVIDSSDLEIQQVIAVMTREARSRGLV